MFKNLKDLGYPNYAINEGGVVINVHSGRVIKIITPKECETRQWSYPTVQLADASGERKTLMLHKILAQVFLDKPEGSEVVNHKDGNKLNFSLSNLEWVTASENTLHAYRTGLHSWNVFDISLAVRACELLESGTRPKEVAEILGVSYSNVYDILVGKTYKDISCGYCFDKVTRRERTSLCKVTKICEAIQNKGDKSLRKISEELGVSYSVVKTIFSRKRHAYISQNFDW